MKTVLIISYQFPPLGGGGVQRTLKYVKYLPKHGWQPIVLTVSNPLGVYDPSLLKEVPVEANVFRLPYLEPAHMLRQSRNQKGNNGSFASSGDEHREPAQMKVLSFRQSFPRRIIDGILNNILLPDRKITWLPPAVFTGIKLLRCYDIQVIYSTYGPGSTHLIAWILKHMSGLPWIADFRDPWLRSPYDSRRNAWQRFIVKRLEASVLRDCDYLTATNQETIDGMLADHGRITPPRNSILINGYDPSDFETDEKVINDRFTLLYSGKVYQDRSPEPVFKAISQLLIDGVVAPNRIQIRFVGVFPGEFKLMAQDYGLAEQTIDVGYVSHKQAVKEMKGGHLLFLTIHSGHASHSILPGKVLEYLAMGRPILYVGPSGAATRLLSQTEGTYIVDHADIEGLKGIIRERYMEFEQEGSVLYDRSSYIAPWTREELAGNLAQIMNSLIK